MPGPGTIRRRLRIRGNSNNMVYFRYTMKQHVQSPCKSKMYKYLFYCLFGILPVDRFFPVFLQIFIRPAEMFVPEKPPAGRKRRRMD